MTRFAPFPRRYPSSVSSRKTSASNTLSSASLHPLFGRPALTGELTEQLFETPALLGRHLGQEYGVGPAAGELHSVAADDRLLGALQSAQLRQD